MDSPSSKAHRSIGDAIESASLAFAVLGLIVSAIFAVIELRSTDKIAEMQNRQSSATAEMNNKQAFLQIAVGVLSQRTNPDKDGNPTAFSDSEQTLRRWAVDMLNISAPREAKIPQDAVGILVTGEAWLAGTGFASNQDGTGQTQGGSDIHGGNGRTRKVLPDGSRDEGGKRGMPE